MDKEVLDLKSWLEQYDEAERIRLMAEAVAEKRVCGVCLVNSLGFCSKCRPLQL